MEKKNKNPYKNFMEAFGDDYIMRISIEELSELIKAICKYKRKCEDVDTEEKELRYKILDGIADVEICIEELAYMFDGFDEINKIKYEKIEKGTERALKYKEKNNDISRIYHRKCD
ncbi:MAG TPA: hypothetical protein IAC38_00500 [Candidatus Caccovivens faecavium]|nr:hypothetical protein [Candidatus Caccovivens faecavium]